MLNPFDPLAIINSVNKTGRLVVVDSGTKTGGFASEVITSICETIDVKTLKCPPTRVTLENAPAPTSKFLEKDYYITKEDVVRAVKEQLY